MTNEELLAFRQQLAALGARLTSEIAERRGQSPRSTGEDPEREKSGMADIEADAGNRDSEAELTIHLLNSEEQVLAEVDAALARIENGTFGKCADCIKPIARERLRTVPYARYCVACAQAREPKPTPTEP